jgi:NADPH:quinone reductase-like Zn-dependent oxidoreductase
MVWQRSAAASLTTKCARAQRNTRAHARHGRCDEVVCSASEDVAARVRAITGGGGACSVIDSVGGALSQQLGAAVRDGGVVWLYGLMDGLTITGSGVDCLFRCVLGAARRACVCVWGGGGAGRLVVVLPCQGRASVCGVGVPLLCACPTPPAVLARHNRDVSYRGFWLVPWLEGKSAAEQQAVVSKVLQLMEGGVLAPAVGKTFPLRQWKEAVAESQVVGRVGKVLLRLPDDA